MVGRVPVVGTCEVLVFSHGVTPVALIQPLLDRRTTVLDETLNIDEVCSKKQ